MAERLTDDEIQAALAKVPEWRLEEKTIWRRYRFPSFMEAVGFVNRVAEVAERRNHHPFISLDYKVVTLRLTSWHAGGLTQADFDEAAEFDALYGSAGQA
ncbi:4a-hydroxytetrahydrobiopterin dehydratase [Alicyclobacillus macrosporangiidus]|jgi:4a-hydroxytetrahydrobiopterin dehydratase|uniref:Putative pterin-4-alpha-carbinolamine dehydratase n=1 Tax=Alicyclobacillus macrosporangiidus TaxID=392015 RepID=A0A1I7IHA0_9BACL|nr:4a-hydroxytetrahydrobiopterin dehydratase [Alicyclobacillus macrosporangiidus]SFU72282.1 4a-hydroxytetrahydrobiopterin dehydratase [Alicyclobacillus macrosporangiidus]